MLETHIPGSVELCEGDTATGPPPCLVGWEPRAGKEVSHKRIRWAVYGFNAHISLEEDGFS